MANLSSRPHRTQPAGSYVKPDINGFVRLGLVIALFAVLAFIFLNFISVPKTPVTAEQVKSVMIEQGYEPQDISNYYYNRDTDFKSVLKKCIAIEKDDLHFEFFEFNNDNSAVSIYSQAYQEISYKYNAAHSIEIDTQIANYSIYLLDSLGKYNVAIYVGNTAIYAYCDSENKTEIDKILDAIDYLKA